MCLANPTCKVFPLATHIISNMAKGGGRRVLGLPRALPDPPPCACSLVAPLAVAAPLPLARCSGVGLSVALGAPAPPAPAPLFRLYMHAISISICTMLCGVYVCKPVRLRCAWLRSAPCGRPSP